MGKDVLRDLHFFSVYEELCNSDDTLEELSAHRQGVVCVFK